MVAAISSSAATPPPSSHPPPNPKNPSDLPRPPLLPAAEKDNAAVLRRPRTKDITSRYLSSSSSSTSTSYSSATSTTSSTSTPRRFPSPLLTPHRPSSPTLPSPARRSHSVDRSRPSTPPSSAAARALSTTATTTRSLSVSFQGESFFYQTRKPAPTPARKATPERRRSGPTNTPARSTDQSENSRPPDHHHHRWPAAHPRNSNPLSRSLNCSSDKRDPIFATVRLLQNSILFEDSTRRASFDSVTAADLSASSDTDSVSSGSNSGAPELSLPPRAKARGISVPARFWQETNSRLRRLTEPGTPVRASSVKKPNLVDSPSSSPRSASSPMRGPVRSASPSKLAGSPSRGMASPLRTRGGGSVMVAVSPVGQPGNAPSIISFAAEVRRAKKGENRIEEAHLLRLMDNRHLQWRSVNARANAALMVQRVVAEKTLYNAWRTTSDLRDSVTLKRIKLQILTQNLRLTSILRGQMTYLEEWSHMDRDHSGALSGAIEALKASTLRLPVVGGARADLKEVKDAVGSAVDVMQAMGSSICSLLSKVEGMSSLVSELAKMAAQERALLDQSRDLLSTVAGMHVTQCSLRGHLLQLKCRPSPMQL